MATEKQIAANRQNAKKSTGPKTPKGKAIAAKNAQKHGLYSCDNVLPEESKAEYRALVFRILQEREINSAEDEQLVRLLADTLWQLRRSSRVDAELYQMYGMYEGQDRGVGTAFAHDATQGNSFSKLARYRRASFRQLADLIKILDNRARSAKSKPVGEISQDCQPKEP